MKIKYIAFSVCSLFSVAAQAADEVTPYRPGAGSPAVLSATGRFEVEVGFDRASGGGATATSLGGLLKYGLSDNIGLLFGVPYLRASDGTSSAKGFGDSFVGLKWVQKANEQVAYGVQATASLPTGSKQFGSDKSVITLTGLLGADVAGFRLDANLGASRSGEAIAGVSSVRKNYSLGISRALGGGLGVGVELSGGKQSGAASTTTLLGAVTYTVNSNLAVDGSVSRTRTAGLGVNAVGIGMSYLVPK